MPLRNVGRNACMWHRDCAKTHLRDMVDSGHAIMDDSWVISSSLYAVANSLRSRGARNSGSHPYSYAHCGLYCCADARTNCYSGADTDNRTHSHSACYADSNTSPYAEAHTNTPAYTNAHADSYAPAYD